MLLLYICVLKNGLCIMCKLVLFYYREKEDIKAFDSFNVDIGDDLIPVSIETLKSWWNQSYNPTSV